MFRSLRCLSVIMAALVTVVPAAAQQRIWTVTGEDVPGWGHVDAGVEDYMQTWAVPGAALAVASAGRLLFAHGYTWDTADAEIIRPESLFRIASMSKPITSVAVHQLIERGLLSHDTRVVDVLALRPPPGQTPDPRLADVTVDHLLYHTGGWDRDLTYDPMFQDEYIAASLGVELPISKWDIATFMTGRRMQFDPGARYAYSNYGYCLLGLIIEQITGRDYSEWVAENIFQPIGVGRPRRGHSTLHERAPGEVRYYGVPGDDAQYSINVENMDSHGGWVLSAPDYVRFLGALFDDFDASPLLSRRSLEDMVEVNAATSEYYGRGWVVTRENGAAVYGHSGSLPGTLTNGRWAEPGIAMAAFINTRKQMDDLDLADPTVIPTHDFYSAVGIADEGLGAALAEWWVPVVASGGGVGGSVWRSDVVLLNRSMLTNTARVRVEQPSLAVDRELELPAGAQLTLDDVVADLGLSGSGSLRVFGAEPLSVSSRTYNVSPGGTFGQFLGGVTGPGGLGHGDTAVLMHLREDTAARSNIGILNAGRREARVELILKDGSGVEVGRAIRRIPPRQTTQLNRPFSGLGGRTDIAPGSAEITVLDGEEVVVYGSVVDNGTNDPTTIPMKTGAGSTVNHVSAVAHGDGAAGSVWRSDVGLLNTGTDPVVVTLELFLGAVGVPPVVITLSPGEQRLLEDVVALAGADGSGSLKVSSTAPILVSSRTYNRSSDGTFGQYLDGAGAQTTIAEGTRVWLQQLRQDAAFRSNIGLHNTGDRQTRAKIHFHDADGVELGVATRTLAAGARIQLQEPFDRLAGRNDLESCYAVVEVEDGDGLLAYASVIDNTTNDPTTVPMMR